MYYVCMNCIDSLIFNVIAMEQPDWPSVTWSLHSICRLAYNLCGISCVVQQQLSAPAKYIVPAYYAYAVVIIIVLATCVLVRDQLIE